VARVYVTDTGGLDFGPGVAALREAGHDVAVLERARQSTSPRTRPTPTP
jgi:hypothetical protein